jgi:hypothetical protein
VGIFDDIFAPVNKALKGQPVAPQPASSAPATGQGPSQQDVDDQWRKDNLPNVNDHIDALHPTGGN